MYPSARLLCNMPTSPTLPITQQTTHCHHKLGENEPDKGAEDVIHLIFRKVPVLECLSGVERVCREKQIDAATDTHMLTCQHVGSCADMQIKLPEGGRRDTWANRWRRQ